MHTLCWRWFQVWSLWEWNILRGALDDLHMNRHFSQCNVFRALNTTIHLFCHRITSPSRHSFPSQQECLCIRSLLEISHSGLFFLPFAFYTLQFTEWKWSQISHIHFYFVVWIYDQCSPHLCGCSIFNRYFTGCPLNKWNSYGVGRVDMPYPTNDRWLLHYKDV